MADVTGLVVQIEERRARLDQVDQAIAEIRRLFAPTKQKRRRRQLRLPLAEPEKKAERYAPSVTLSTMRADG